VNEEQSKRLSDAAESVLSASEALEEAREAMADARFESEQERERAQAAQQMASRMDNAARRVEDALRKGTVAAAALAREGAFSRYRTATAAAREGRSLAKSAPNQDGTAAKRDRGSAALAKLDEAMEAAAAIVFGG
jgi:hypothetical protein